MATWQVATKDSWRRPNQYQTPHYSPATTSHVNHWYHMITLPRSPTSSRSATTATRAAFSRRATRWRRLWPILSSLRHSHHHDRYQYHRRRRQQQQQQQHGGGGGDCHNGTFTIHAHRIHNRYAPRRVKFDREYRYAIDMQLGRTHMARPPCLLPYSTLPISTRDAGHDESHPALHFTVLPSGEWFRS